MKTWNRPLDQCLWCFTPPVDIDEHYRKCPKCGIVWPYSDHAIAVESERKVIDRQWTETETRIEEQRKRKP